MSTAASSGNTLLVRPTPFLHNHINQPDANLPMHGAVNMAPGQPLSATSDALPQGPRAPVVTTRDDSKASSFEAIPRTAIQLDAKAYFDLGKSYQYGRGVEQNDGEAFKYFQLAADQGHDVAQYNVGLRYRSGRGVEPNDGKAFKYFQLAADQGHDVAQFNLALAYQNGRDAEQNYVAAAKYYQLAADQGNARAQNNLGVMYQTGSGVAQSDAKAIKYLRLAADQGLANTQFNLGFMYQNGCGVAQSDAKAVKYYQLATDQGNAKAQRTLRTFYREGKGVPSDAKEALRCFWKANHPTNVIDLSGFRITDNMLQHLPALFEEFGGYGQTKERPPVTSLNLAGNPITDASAPFIALILKQSKTLTRLTLYATAITDDGMKIILDALKNYNASVVDCGFSSGSKATEKRLDELIGQNKVIEEIMDGMDTQYPMDIPKEFDVLPMDVLRQLLPTIAVAHAKNPAPLSLSTTISSMFGYKPATTEQAMDEVYTALMIDPASASLRSKIKPDSHLIHFVR